ncbi:MAG: GGDEF domain-containing protein, partial [Candidatus Cloacimonetes bacterium]|nr:GGDEF domain-containing protein [Candidatus Cloacimonadota bacterium]
MKQKNELNHNSDISQYLTIDSAEQANLRKLVADLIVSDDLNRPPIIDTLIGIVEKACPQSLKCPVFCDYAAVIIDSFMDYLLRVKSSCESELYHFFNWINHFPITPGTPFYPSFIRHISPEIESDPRVLENLNQLQLLYVFTEIKDWDNAYSLYEEIAKQVDRSILPLWVLLHICHVRILRHNNELKPFLNLELMLITESYSIDGSDSSLYFLIRWIIATKWQKQTILKKILLNKLYAKLGEQKSLNNAIVMFELFSLGDSLVPYAEKLNLQKKLIKFP